jgi:hypothetical protein
MCIRTFSQGTRVFVPHSKSGSVIVFINSHFLLVDEIIATNQKQPLKLKSFERMHKKEEIPLHVIIMIIIEYYSFVFTHLV